MYMEVPFLSVTANKNVRRALLDHNQGRSIQHLTHRDQPHACKGLMQARLKGKRFPL